MHTDDSAGRSLPHIRTRSRIQARMPVAAVHSNDLVRGWHFMAWHISRICGTFKNAAEEAAQVKSRLPIPGMPARDVRNCHQTGKAQPT
jgi:hypothetical protein